MHFCPVLQAQVYPDPTNVRGGNLSMEMKLAFPQSCSEGPSSQPNCVQGSKVTGELLVSKGRKTKSSITWLEESTFPTPQLFRYGRKNVYSLGVFVFLKTIIICVMRPRKELSVQRTVKKEGKKRSV